MSNTWKDHSDFKEKEYYYDMKCSKKHDRCDEDKCWDDGYSKKHKKSWDDKCCKKHDKCWDDECCKKYEKSWDDECCKKYDKSWDDECCMKHDKTWDDECCKKHDKTWDDECCKKHDKSWDDKCCKKQDTCWDDECCKKNDKCCEKCDSCHEIKELLKESYRYAFRARLAILAIFEYKNPCKHMEVIKYFLCKAKEAVKCLFKILEKLYWCFNKKCFHCEYEASCLIQKAIENTEEVAYKLYGIEKLCDPCCNKYEYCESVYLISCAVEKIEDVVREIETLFKLFKKHECKKC